jgi:hypothetical protein
MPRALPGILFEPLVHRLHAWVRKAEQLLGMDAGAPGQGFPRRARRFESPPMSSHALPADEAEEWSMASAEACLRMLHGADSLENSPEPGTRHGEDRGDLVNLPGFVEQFAAQHETEAATRSVQIRVDMPPDALVFGDAPGLHRLIEGHLLDAFRHTPDGGCLTILGAVAQGGVKLTAASSGQGSEPLLWWRLAYHSRTGGNRPSCSSMGSGQDG